MIKAPQEIARKLRILEHSEDHEHVAKTRRYFGIGRSSFYRWREAYRKHGDAGLVNKPTIPTRQANRTPVKIEEKILYLRSYKGDVDLKAKLGEWERFYNFARPRGAFNGKTPYEALREKL